MQEVAWYQFSAKISSEAWNVQTGKLSVIDVVLLKKRYLSSNTVTTARMLQNNNKQSAIDNCYISNLLFIIKFKTEKTIYAWSLCKFN